MIFRRILPLLPAALVALSGCKKEAENSAGVGGAQAATVAQTPREAAAGGGAASPSQERGATPSAPEWPLFAVTGQAAGVYVGTSFKARKLGYLRNGGRTAVEPTIVSRQNCAKGWYKVVAGGYICGDLGTTDLSSPAAKSGTHPPNLDEVLPYNYARNSKHGTPLYHKLPTPAQVLKYEPYRVKKPKSQEQVAASTMMSSAVPSALASSGMTTPQSLVEGQELEPDKPWWQQENIKDRLHEMKLDELEAEADTVLAKRMVQGFYIAIDKALKDSGRTWYKTTKGLYAAADRFWKVQGPTFKGVELGTDWKLPVAWVYAGFKTSPGLEIDPATKQIQPLPGRSYEHFAPIQLTGNKLDIKGKTYMETADGAWVRRSTVRVAGDRPFPKDLSPTEKWIDVDLDGQTLVAFEGQRPVYATMISSGRPNREDEDKDHSTPVGEWRIREKHLASTMDGDGNAEGGDLPYSIEDVPFGMFFYRAYALHGAFWHNNFGVQMSHGCVNLAPLDAKYLFFFTDPPLPPGWHGVWENKDRPGSRVVLRCRSCPKKELEPDFPR